MSSSSSSSETPGLLDTSAAELAWMITQPDAPATISRTFAGQHTSLALLRQYAFVSTGVYQLRTELSRHRKEQNSLFHILMTSQPFQDTISPILQEFRRRRVEENPSSYQTPSPEPIPPAFQTVPSSPVMTERIEERSRAPSPRNNEPRTVEMHSPSLENITLSNEHNPIPPTLAVNTGLFGSQENPIDIDQIPDHLVRLDSGLRRPRSSPIPLRCLTCGRNGHTSPDCIWSGPIVCGYCMEIGHGQRNCRNLRRDMARYDSQYNFCMLCGQPGHRLEQCMSLQYQQ